MKRIRIYNGIQIKNDLKLIGRFEQYISIPEVTEDDSVWKNIRSTLRRFLSKGIAQGKLNFQTDNGGFACQTDKNGYFEIELQMKDGQVLKKTEDLLKAVESEKGVSIYHDTIRTFSPDLSNAVISDVDDTFLVTHATAFLKKLQLLLLKNAYTRQTVRGVKDRYDELTNKGEIPVFYVSNSEWELYDFLKDIIAFNGFPNGILYLRKSAFRIQKFWKIGKAEKDHKLNVINELYQSFPGCDFTLIGDNGQKDPDVYREIASRYPYRTIELQLREVKKWSESKKNQYAHSLPDQVKLVFFS